MYGIERVMIGLNAEGVREFLAQGNALGRRRKPEVNAEGVRE
jgi:hypothetical protein